MAEGIELYAGTVHVASFAFQALFVTKRRFRPHTLVLMFVDVQKTNSRVPQQCRIRNIFLGRKPANGTWSIAIVGLSWKHFRILMLRGTSRAQQEASFLASCRDPRLF